MNKLGAVILFCTLWGIGALRLSAQELSAGLLEGMADESGSVLVEEMLLLLTPDEMVFDVNDSTDRERMMTAGILDAAQYNALRDYIKRYGPLLSIFELGVIDAFPPSWTTRWQSWLSCGIAARVSSKRWKLIAEQGIRFRSPAAEEEQRGGFRSTSRMSLKHMRNAEFRLVAASGEGERYFRPGSSPAPEWVSGSLSLRPGSICRQVIIGDFRVQGGYGLRYGAGWSSWDGRYPLSLPYQPFRLMASATSVEGSALRGMAAEFRSRTYRLSTYASHQASDGSLQESERLDWSEGAAGDHRKLVAQARRGRSHIARTGARLGKEKENARYGMSLDAIRVSTTGPDSNSRKLEYSDACIGADMQYHGGRWELGLEAAAWLSGPSGFVLGYTLFPEGWIGLRFQWMLIEGQLPFPQLFTEFGQPTSSREGRIVSTSFRWGKGWELSAGVGRWQKRGVDHPAIQREERLHLILNHATGDRQSIRASLSAKLREEAPGSTGSYGKTIAFRCMWERKVSEGWRLEGGQHLVLAGSGSIWENGMGIWNGLRLRLNQGRIRAVRFDIAMHASRSADTRTYFWMSGAEGRIGMQTLYYDGWKSSIGLDLGVSQYLSLSAGLGYGSSYRECVWTGNSLEAGLRLSFRPQAF